jgi:hypothetical protein
VGPRPAERSGARLLRQLTNAPYKRYVEIGEGTHSIMMEKNRMQFFREIMNFLDERDPQGVN